MYNNDQDFTRQSYQSDTQNHYSQNNFCPSCGKELTAAANFCSSCGKAISIDAAATQSFQSEFSTTKIYAGFWKRVAARFIDVAICGLIGGAVGVFVGVAFYSDGNIAELETLGYIFGFLAAWLYFAIMESSKHQATLGKMALGIKVIDYQGNRISFFKAAGRFIIPQIVIGFCQALGAAVFEPMIFIAGILVLVFYAMAGFTERKQAFHDFAMSTLVVNKEQIPYFQSNTEQYHSWERE